MKGIVVMKRNVFFSILASITMLLAACTGSSPVDLTNITCDGISLGEKVEDIDVYNYTLSHRFPKKENTITFEEWRITTDTDDNSVKRIFANFSSIEVSVNSKIYNGKVDDIITALGNSYTTDWYDREQRLKQVVYIDHDNRIQATFVYDNRSNHLVWTILQSFD